MPLKLLYPRRTLFAPMAADLRVNRFICANGIKIKSRIKKTAAADGKRSQSSGGAIAGNQWRRKEGFGLALSCEARIKHPVQPSHRHSRMLPAGIQK